MRRPYIPMILLLLALLLGACELPGSDDDNDDDDDDDRRNPLTQVEGNSGSGNVNDRDETDGADADAADEPDEEGAVEPDEEGAVEPDRATVARRLADLGLSLPDGATLDSAPHFGAQDIQLQYEVVGRSPAQVLAFYRERLAAAGYQIDDEDDEEIAFSSDSLSGEIEVDERDGTTQLEIDLDLE